jgi:hypothetical protein
MPRNVGPSRVWELIPDRRSADAQGVPQPDSTDPDLDAALTGLNMLLRVALRLMQRPRDDGLPSP